MMSEHNLDVQVVGTLTTIEPLVVSRESCRVYKFCADPRLHDIVFLISERTQVCDTTRSLTTTESQDTI